MAALAATLLQRELGGVPKGGPTPAQRLAAWSEAGLAQHTAAAYAAFQPPPRSTIALSYNCDGTLLASTHGDHTVKLSCCATGRLERVLSGHRRTPWVVRFHPRKPNLLASGSLDHEVRLWDATTGQCIARHTFGKPIASLAFHVCADVLAIGCGHKLYMWEYAAHGKLPVIVLKTRRSMRAVHFHPHGLPVVLTAEVQDPSPTPELPATLTEEGAYLLQPEAAAEQVAAEASGSDMCIDSQQQQQPGAAEPRRPAAGLPSSSGSGGLAGLAAPPSVDVPIPSAQLLQGAAGSSSSSQQRGDRSPAAAPGVYVATTNGPVPVGRQGPAAASSLDLPAATLSLATPLHQLRLGSQGVGAPSASEAGATAAAAAAAAGPSGADSRQQAASTPAPAGPLGRPGAPGWVPPGSAQLPPSMVPTGWELPFPASLFAGGEQAAGAGPAGPGDAASNSWAATAASLPQVMAAFSAAAWNIIGQEQPPRVRLRLWRFDADKPTALLAVMGQEAASGNLLLQIGDAVLCSEMGVHISPDGRFLACTTACRGPLPTQPLPGGLLVGEDELEALQPSQAEVDAALAAALGGPITLRHQPAVFAPLHLDGRAPHEHRHAHLLRRQGSEHLSAAALPPLPLQGGDAADGLPGRLLAGGASGAAAAAAEAAAAAAAAAAVAAQQLPERVVFEVRVYSMDGPTFGQVVRAKRIRAAHCLTSVQFSPGCGHMLLAYGKKHISLLRSLVADRGSVLPLHTIMEVFRLSDMELVRVLPSAEDEINAACFHPRAGGGIAYGTKEGRLRVISLDRSAMAEDPAEGAEADAEAGGAPSGAAAAGGAADARGEQEQHPSQRELDNLRQWVMTQQWLQQQALGGGGGGGAPPAAPM